MKNTINIKILFILCLLLPLIGFSQINQIQIKKFSIGKDSFVAHIEVLRSDTNVKHGSYLLSEIVSKDSVRRSCNEVIGNDSLFYYTLLEKGNYQMGKKEGIWKENFGLKFYRIGNYKDNLKEGLWQEFYDNKICGEGYYQTNKKIGTWKYYSIGHTRNEDKTYLIYNYDKDSTLFLDASYMRHEDSLFFHRIDTPKLATIPIFPYGGYHGLSVVLSDFNSYIWSYFFDSYVFNVYYQVNIDENGFFKAKVIKVNKDDNNYLANFFNRHLKIIPSNWIPARASNNKKVSTSTIFPLKIIIE